MFLPCKQIGENRQNKMIKREFFSRQLGFAEHYGYSDFPSMAVRKCKVDKHGFLAESNSAVGSPAGRCWG
jgi:hypothetical protein